MRPRLWAGGLALGAAAAVLLGISMLAARETTEYQAAGPDRYLLGAGIDKAYASVFVPPGITRTMDVPCVGKERIDGSERLSASIILVDRRSNLRQARCLHRHGFLSASDVAGVVGTPHRWTRHGIGRVVPRSLQLEPSSLSVGGWIILLGLEAAGGVFLVRSLRQTG